MSLKTDYGLATALNTAFVAGKQYVLGTCSISGYDQQSECVLGGGVWTASGCYATLSAGLVSNSAQGNTDFTITVLVTHAPATLRLQGKYWDAFKDGIMYALASEGIYSTECTVSLNTTDNINTSIDFTFSF